MQHLFDGVTHTEATRLILRQMRENVAASLNEVVAHSGDVPPVRPLDMAGVAQALHASLQIIDIYLRHIPE